MINYNNKRGSLALISVLIISAFVLILAVAMSESNITTSYQALNNQSGKLSYYGAEACFEEAMIRLKADSSFNAETLNIDDDHSCIINVAGSTVNITVNYLNYSRDFQADINISQDGQANNIQLLNWQEI